MQDIPDKDFNEVFRQKFESFEVEPSSAVWRGIASELDDNRQKKPFPVFWIMAAASVLIVFSTGLWLFSPKEKIRLHGKTNDLVIQDELPSEITSAPPIIKVVGKQQKNAKAIQPGTSIVAVTNSLKSGSPEQKTIEQEALRSEEAPLKEIEAIKMDNIVLKDQKTHSITDQPVLALVNNRAPGNNTKEDIIQQRRGKTIGDLVNLVVGKVDPREDKIIQFSDDGDGGSEVSGINLFLLKIKKQK